MMEAWTKNQRKIETSSAELRLDDEIIEKRNPGENWRFFFGGRGGRSDTHVLYLTIISRIFMLLLALLRHDRADKNIDINC